MPRRTPSRCSSSGEGRLASVSLIRSAVSVRCSRFAAGTRAGSMFEPAIDHRPQRQGRIRRPTLIGPLLGRSVPARTFGQGYACR